MADKDWATREARPADGAFIRSTLIEDLIGNSYFYGVSREKIRRMASEVIARAINAGARIIVAVPNDPEDAAAVDEVAGWVMFMTAGQAGQLTVVNAYVEPSYRGLGAWRTLRDAIKLEPGQIVSCVLQSPRAMQQARSVYAAKHNWGRALEWLS